jgi:hypothetical protein
MSVKVNVVVTCTQRKALPVASGLHAGALRGSVTARLEQWLDRLRRPRTAVVPAVDLYAGESWSVVRSVLDEPRARWDARLWICSAGYGLVPSRAPLSSYAATFAHGERDSVVAHGRTGSGSQRRAWWSGLAGWAGPTRQAPRTLTQLAEQHPRTPLLLAASQPYLDAMATDLVAARDQLRQPELLSLLSAGGSFAGPLGEHLLPYDGRFQQRVGGAMLSLNVRVLAWLLREHRGHLTVDALARTITKYSHGLSDMPTHDRKPVSDDDLRSFVKVELAKDPNAKHTGLLRKLRDGGSQCEQSRFRRLYMEIKEAQSGKR